MRSNHRLIYIIITIFIVIVCLIFVLVYYFIVSSKSSSNNKHNTSGLYNLLGPELFRNPLFNFSHFNNHTFNQSEILFNRPCGQSNTRIKRIIGGEDAIPHSHPWLVSLRIYRNQILYDHFCGGILITNIHILTSAHCVKHLPKDSIIIAVVGLHIRNDVSDQAFQNSLMVQRIVLHENFNENSLENDLAILCLSEPVSFSSNVSIICLPTDGNADDKEKRDVIVAGWGNNNQKLLTLQQTRLTLINNENDQCGRYLRNVNLKNFYCALNRSFNKVSNACSGDR